MPVSLAELREAATQALREAARTLREMQPSTIHRTTAAQLRWRDRFEEWTRCLFALATHHADDLVEQARSRLESAERERERIHLAGTPFVRLRVPDYANPFCPLSPLFLGEDGVWMLRRISNGVEVGVDPVGEGHHLVVGCIDYLADLLERATTDREGLDLADDATPDQLMEAFALDLERISDSLGSQVDRDLSEHRPPSPTEDEDAAPLVTAVRSALRRIAKPAPLDAVCKAMDIDDRSRESVRQVLVRESKGHNGRPRTVRATKDPRDSRRNLYSLIPP